MWRSLIAVLLLAPAIALAQGAKYCEPRNPYDPASGCAPAEAAPAPQSSARVWLTWGQKEWQFHLGLCREGSKLPWYVQNCSQLENIYALCHGSNVGERAKAMCAQFFGEPLSATMMAYIKVGLEHKEGLKACWSIGSAFSGLQVGSVSGLNLSKKKSNELKQVATKQEQIRAATQKSTGQSKPPKITRDDVLEYAKKGYEAYDKYDEYSELATKINSYIDLVQYGEPWRVVLAAGGVSNPTSWKNGCFNLPPGDQFNACIDRSQTEGLAKDIGTIQRLQKILDETDTIKCMRYSDELLKQLGVRS
jgi:hypothetical protein